MDFEVQDPQQAEARGRNGWFTPRAFSVWRDHEGILILDVHSSRPGKSPPIMIGLSPADMASLARFLCDAVAVLEDS